MQGEPVRLSQEHTTMTLPHRRVCHGGQAYYVATYPEGDLAIHSHSPSYQEGYGGSLVRFLMEDGSYEDVRGAFARQGIFDAGLREALRDKLGPAADLAANRITLFGNPSGNGRVELFAELTWRTEPLRDRMVRACEMIGERESWPSGLECIVEGRGYRSYFNRRDIEDMIGGE